MNLCINGNSNKNLYTLSNFKNKTDKADPEEIKKKNNTKDLTNDKKINDKDDSKKNKQIISYQDGKYYFTYMISDDGSKILLNKVKVNNTVDTKKTNSLFNTSEHLKTIFKYKENLNSCSKDEQSLKEIISSLKNCYNI
ncbi:hypothetical protein [Clostridium butyricum]|uniref:Uncharacterized protein n=1 Tax=Clostridium butyricum TaxID=1492 RepID=A0A0A6PTI6_CLOBU|nr:hypothetical protein [Clostridium butyricum]KHD13713.1 hypothetical protein OA81_19245 [Clostridium butyricum]KHD15699.1 hypothetical protein OA81_07630 [Clostridium butyricum]PPV12128.1 hypothetical protein AWN73_19830 [Clostridium butyricum]